jgi:hypothetical protein
MSQRAQNQPSNVRFVELMRAGHVAFSKGKRQQAHDIWRHAAMLHPYDEQVWLALLNVLDSEDDRRVCLQNIVAINPNNLQAQAQLVELGVGPTQPVTPLRIEATKPRGLLRVLLLRGLEAITIGVLLGIAISLVQAIIKYNLLV